MLGPNERKPARRRPRFRAWLEELEQRLAPASFAVSAQLAVSRLDAGASGPSRAVVFFESAVDGYAVLRQGLELGTDAVLLDKGGDGLVEMAVYLAGRH